MFSRIRFGEMPWVTLKRRVDAMERALNPVNIKDLEEMRLKLDTLAQAVSSATSALADLTKKVSDLEAAASADAAADQVIIDELTAKLEGAMGGSMGGSTGGITG